MSAPTTKETIREIKKYLPKLTREHKELGDAFNNHLGPAALKDGAVSEKNKELIALGIAIHSQCEYCIALHVQNCLDAGASREEIVETCGVAVLMGGGPSLMYCTQVMKALDELSE